MRILLLFFAVVLTFPVRAMDRADFELQELEFSSPGCWSNCPAFRLIVRPDHTIEYFAIRFSKLSGAFYASLAPARYDSLLTLVRAVHPDSLRAEYEAEHQDPSSLYLHIIHNGLKVSVTELKNGQEKQTWLRAGLGGFTKFP
jgi:hypothetical protein